MKKARYKVISGIFLFLLSITFTGCIGLDIQPPQQQKLTKVPKNLQITQHYKLQGISDSDSIPKSEIDNLLVKKLYDMSSKRALKAYDVSRKHGKMLSARKLGLEIESTKTAFILSYKAGYEYYNEDGSTKKIYAYKKYIIGKKYHDEGKNISITVSYPQSYEIVTITQGMKIGFNLDGFDNSDEDVYNLFKSFSEDSTNLVHIVKEGLNVNKSLIKDGEINTKFNSEAVYANFERKLGKYKWGYNSNIKIGDLKKENTFKLKLGKKIVPINITVYPYKNGSKVVYKAFIDYTINTTRGPDVKTEDINAIHSKIVSIAND